MKKIVLALFISLASVCVFAQDSAPKTKTVTDVYEDVEVAVNQLGGRVEDGFIFIVEGYIYPAGTLTGGNGVLADGSPEFPDKIIGLWTCNGWTSGPRDPSITPVAARTWQSFEFDLIDVGNNMIMTHGYEQLQLAAVMTRAITGATGIFAEKGGVQRQSIIGINPTGGPNYASTFSVTYEIPFKDK